jgi:hypothetical protein
MMFDTVHRGMSFARVAYGLSCNRSFQMPVSWRENRLSQLNAMRSHDPARIISMYRAIAGLTVDNQLPHNASFMSMIGVILENEDDAHQALLASELSAMHV